MNHTNSGFLKDHSLKYIEMALRTDNIEKISNPDGYGKRTGECGDTIEFFLICHENILESVSFCTRGCMNTNACCNTVAELAQGISVNKAWEIMPEQVIEYLETLPDDHSHCAELAVGVFYLALSDLKAKKPISLPGNTIKTEKGL